VRRTSSIYLARLSYGLKPADYIPKELIALFSASGRFGRRFNGCIDKSFLLNRMQQQYRPPIQKADDYKKYLAYLRSEKWKRKRNAVFQRENGICQGCMEEPIENIHHTPAAYAHLYDEPLFELIGLCETCHRKVHFIYQSDEPIEY